MKILVTGSSGHLGEGLMRLLRRDGHDAVGVDILPSAYTDILGSISDREIVDRSMAGIEAILHTATLHKPHVGTHSNQDFVDTNVTGTLNLLEAARTNSIRRFVFTSTTSAFGAALSPQIGEPAAWITETVPSIPKNIYGVTKTAAEDLCQLFHRLHGLPVIVLRTSRFFPEEDDSKAMRAAFSDDNAKANEFLFRRVDLEDAALAHVRALERAPDIGFGKYIISATTPFEESDLKALRQNGAEVVSRYHPEMSATYAKTGWRMFDDFDRVYVNALARDALGWVPQYDFGRILKQLEAGEPIGSQLARDVGRKGYHEMQFEEGPYPVG